MPAEVGDADAGRRRGRGLRISKRWPDVGEADEPAGETPEETGETTTDEAVDSEASRAEGDAEDPETKATRREGLN